MTTSSNAFSNNTSATFIANWLPVRTSHRIFGPRTHCQPLKHTFRSRRTRLPRTRTLPAYASLSLGPWPPVPPSNRRGSDEIRQHKSNQNFLMNNRVAVVAVGGNSLIKDKAKSTVDDQYAAARETAAHIVDMIEDGWNVVLTHGNGPQVGFDMRRSELAAHELHTVPLDYCDADTQGAIGYMFQRAMHNEFKRRGIDKAVATIVTLVRVSADDPAFANPTKPVGPFLDENTARERMKDGLTFVEDSGRGWRRVVPSPAPIEIVEADAIKTLVDAGVVVIATGGGGIPVVENEEGDLDGIEAVIDKDFASSLLAKVIGADMLLFSTGVPKVALNFNTRDEVWLDKMTLSDAKKYNDEGQFAPGSMKPKIEACIKFLEEGGKQVLVTDPANIPRALRGETGTLIESEQAVGRSAVSAEESLVHH